jgi:dinuclear metal center YbgI/SA1388 family protein
MATVGDILMLLERWAPHEFAMEGDNPGLQCGDMRSRVRKILVSLDATEAVVREAHAKRADMIVTHHPLLFTPLMKVDLQEETGRIIELLTRHRMSLVAAHTNLDFAPEGTSFALARRVGLEQIRFLHTPMKMLSKVVTFVPPNAVDRVADAMTAAGAGTIGNYDACSFRNVGTGTFRGNEHTTPAVGSRGRMEHVEEVRLEMLAPSHLLAEVLGAMKQAHPYEEVAYDIYVMGNTSRDAGMGAIGVLPKPMRLDQYLGQVKKALRIPALRSSTNDRRIVRTVAVCGGSGARLLPEAQRQHADVFITADIKYHTYHEAGERIALVDGGHFETEYPVLAVVAEYLRKSLDGTDRSISISIATQSKNPVQYVS